MSTDGVERPGRQSWPFPLRRPLYIETDFELQLQLCWEGGWLRLSFQAPRSPPELRKQPPLHSLIAVARSACLLLVSCCLQPGPIVWSGVSELLLMDFLLPSLLGVTSPYKAWSGILGPSILHTCPAQWGTGKMEFVHCFYSLLILVKQCQRQMWQS